MKLLAQPMINTDQISHKLWLPVAVFVYFGNKFRKNNINVSNNRATNVVYSYLEALPVFSNSSFGKGHQ